MQKEPGQAAWTGQRLAANTGTPLVATLLCVISAVRLGTQQPAAEILCTIYPCWMELGLQPVPGVTPRKAKPFLPLISQVVLWQTREHLENLGVNGTERRAGGEKQIYLVMLWCENTGCSV